MHIQTIIQEKLSTLNPSILSIENESYKHSVPKDSETHFKIIIVSDKFDGLMLIKRHRKIYELLSDHMNKPIHALALHTYTQDEWEHLADKTLASPNCMGGSQKD